MHVNFRANNNNPTGRIELWELLEMAGEKQQEELIQCAPSKNLRSQARRMSADENRRSDADSTTLTIANIRKGESLAASKLPFLWKLHEMLEDVEKTGDDHIVSWMNGGRCFRVHKPKSFMQKIVPHYFKQSRFKSFQRQLHLYDFVRTTQGVLAGSYAQPLFIRGKKSLCLSATPHKIKGKKRATTSSQQCPTVLNGALKMNGKRPRSEVRGDDPMRHVKSKLQASDSPKQSTTTSTTNAMDWTAIQNVFVTGASLAAQLQKKNEITDTVQSSPDSANVVGVTTCPHHTGDVVYAFGEKPFCFIEEGAVDTATTFKAANTDGLSSEDDDFLLAMALEESIDPIVDQILCSI